MEYTMDERCNRIIEACKSYHEIDPYIIFQAVAKEDFVRIHGPEHHILDGACILCSFYNAGGNINLDEALEKLLIQGKQMPGAICGLWGVCGSVTSIGAALSIIDCTGPLSKDGTWGSHMQFTSIALAKIGEINGPRCCKRDAFLAFREAVDYINRTYDVKLELAEIKCKFSPLNQQCLGLKCPFFEREK